MTLQRQAARGLRLRGGSGSASVLAMSVSHLLENERQSTMHSDTTETVVYLEQKGLNREDGFGMQTDTLVKSEMLQ